MHFLFIIPLLNMINIFNAQIKVNFEAFFNKVDNLTHF